VRLAAETMPELERQVEEFESSVTEWKFIEEEGEEEQFDAEGWNLRFWKESCEK
jgi:hypothetical protein